MTETVADMTQITAVQHGVDTMDWYATLNKALLYTYRKGKDLDSINFRYVLARAKRIKSRGK